ncbi:hypothetical protein SAMN04244579_01185 [Azotobacter beijerinckii]|uniref:Nuclease-related domain-containing protein n=1 Tax=Azotobacter beijerinckii TaxID=170623 RepID=A0A1H6RNB6_9GAMM|nr:hypothetical protein [Azotobacter beijerinckii]SEI57241.1 hypothetical protein SAMN04244579_01185 [Azotobacter beijerinckii]
MLNTYAVEIEVLSKKSVDVDLAKQAIATIREKFPSSIKKRHDLLRVATQSLLENIKSRNYDASFGMFRFVFFTGLEEPLSEARKQGVFRASKAEFNPKLIKELLLELYASGTLSDEEQHYVRSVKGILLVAPDILDLKKKIIAAASSRRYFLKTVLSIAETKYNDLMRYFDERPEKPYADVLFHNNKESILTAASYLVQVYREAIPPLRLRDSNGIDESTDHAFYYNLFEAAFAITNYLEAEIKVDFYDYEVVVDETTKRISVDNVDFETAKSYGYIKTDLRAFSQIRIYERLASSKSYNELLDEFWDRDSQEEQSIVYAIRHEPVERIVLKALFAEYGHKANIFSHDYPFKEEQMQMLALADENYNPDIFETKIYKSFTCFDLFKLQRFFGFVAFIYKKAYEKLKSDGHPNADLIRKRSILPVFDKEELVKIFQNTTGKSQSACEGLLEKLTNEKPATDEVIDLQYKPILTIENRCLVMPTVFACSSLWRSLAISEKVHFSVFGKHDYMVKSVLDTLVCQGFKVRHDFHFGEDEVDIAAIYGEHLFLFECKNPYHPVNDFELRNTHAHLVKGFSQLDNFKNRFSDHQVLDQFLRNLDVEPRLIKNIHYGVINANRALSGFTKNGIRVFHANEFMNFISSGKIISAGDEYCCWRSNNFDISDLISYMDGEIIIEDMMTHKAPMPFLFRFRNYSMYFRTFQYDLSGVSSLHKEKYRYIGPAYTDL